MDPLIPLLILESGLLVFPNGSKWSERRRIDHHEGQVEEEAYEEIEEEAPKDETEIQVEQLNSVHCPTAFDIWFLIFVFFAFSCC
uniref:Uncharacterized protein n=1 Tax=Kalanchoe fedtschenkoi TaxID=63787 RepID=A0A7N0ZUA4_KALFE